MNSPTHIESAASAEPGAMSLQVKRILVPTDFSAPAQKALQYAMRLSETFGAALAVIHVFSPPPLVDYSGGYVPAADMQRFCDAAREGVDAQMAELKRQIEARDIQVSTEVRGGAPHEEIVAAAKRGQCDLIVIATHGYAGFRHALLGSTAERVVRWAPCPVLVVRERERDFVT